jgi:hypothetical protein
MTNSYAARDFQILGWNADTKAPQDYGFTTRKRRGSQPGWLFAEHNTFTALFEKRSARVTRKLSQLTYQASTPAL